MNHSHASFLERLSCVLARNNQNNQNNQNQCSSRVKYAKDYRNGLKILSNHSLIPNSYLQLHMHLCLLCKLRICFTETNFSRRFLHSNAITNIEKRTFDRLALKQLWVNWRIQGFPLNLKLGMWYIDKLNFFFLCCCVSVSWCHTHN